MDPESITLGKYSLPFILSIILGMIYKHSKVPDTYKAYIATACGCLLGIGAMFYNNAYADINFVMIADYVMAGGTAGAAATGIYEMNKSGPTGTSYIALDENGKRIKGAKVAKYSKVQILK